MSVQLVSYDLDLYIYIYISVKLGNISSFIHVLLNLMANEDAKRSPLGVTFASYYMTDLENKIFENDPTLKPTIYCRYVDDCFLVIESNDHLQRGLPIQLRA